MIINSKEYNLWSLFIDRIIYPLLIIPKIVKFRVLSTCSQIIGSPKRLTPTLIVGKGKICFGDRVTIGVKSSPLHLSTYCYIDSRNADSVISIGSSVYINNNACIISEGEGIFIGDNCLIGTNFSVYDSDFHDLHPLRRINGKSVTKKVIIERNVFIGSNVTILKGVTIGENSVIGSNSLVSKSLPANVVAAGNPCKELKNLSKSN